MNDVIVTAVRHVSQWDGMASAEVERSCGHTLIWSGRAALLPTAEQHTSCIECWSADLEYVDYGRGLALLRRAA